MNNIPFIVFDKYLYKLQKAYQKKKKKGVMDLILHTLF
jgi:hypothetical protein